MELETIINKITNNNITKKEALEWKNENNFNLWHVTATQDNSALFIKITSLVNKDEFEQKIKQQNILGDTPAHVAAWSSNLDVLKVIVSNTNNLDYNDEQKRNVAMICLKTKNKPCIEFSLKHTNDINHVDKHTQNLLHYAQNFSNAKIYQKIKLLGTSENVENNLKKTPHSPTPQDEDSILEFVANHKRKTVNV